MKILITNLFLGVSMFLSACAKAISYAKTHKTFLAYIGSDCHGWQMQTYKPVDICPFK